ncbi:hypothetical protein DM482_08655 [Avibacterium paragallinarum]|uniref:Uncharacterized protein n=1 Tax=Avibacterium paragallinarum TaxID=728 RepID=A0AAE5TGU6_AVIPA|nr:hypothetical protein DM482_08655 [Avibacterium paragallinarum]PXZ40981.1 hypothetical protein DM481_08390 [Avibacterium paragallinarum]
MERLSVLQIKNDMKSWMHIIVSNVFINILFLYLGVFPLYINLAYISLILVNYILKIIYSGDDISKYLDFNRKIDSFIIILLGIYYSSFL